METSPSNLQNHWLWQDKPFAKGQAWIDLLLLSGQAQEQTIFRNKFYRTESGQIITSENELCNRWGWSRTKIRSFLLLLKEASMIKLIRDKAKTMITVIQYPIPPETFESKNHQEKPIQIQEKEQEEKQLKPAQIKVIAPINEQDKEQVKIQNKNTSGKVSLAIQAMKPYQLTILDAIERNTK